ncbi:flavin reductase family protein [Leeia oryzae]|uniref:flavin reductase family protein n=1 Tax=Leeia oryzae TaxID=356662 RepID=UPI000366B5DE|nr:flavin reductase family protein [Leeia oryzae]
MEFDPSTLPPQNCYQLMVGAIVPRPIAWISTIDAHGVTNLSPFSFFTVASVNPPVLAFNHVTPRTQTEKDTLRNLKATRQCVVNIVSQSLADVMNASCANYPPGVSEFSAVGIPEVKSQCVQAPGVAGAPVRFECTLREVISIGTEPMGGQLVLLDLVHISVKDDILLDGKIQPDLLQAVGKMGGDDYTTTQDRFSLARPVL